MARAKRERAAQELEAAVPVTRSPMPELPPHPALVKGPATAVWLRVVQHGELLRLTVNDTGPCVWQRQMPVYRADHARNAIAEANAESFVRMEGPDPVFTAVAGLVDW